jgi:hypothetical protein
MKYYSEKLNKVFDTEAELVAEEEKVEAAKVAKEKELAKYKEDRAAKAKEVEEAYAALTEARKNYDKVLREFTNTYGAFHMSINANDLFDSFFRGLW